MTQRANAILTATWMVGLMGDSPADPKPTILTFELARLIRKSAPEG